MAHRVIIIDSVTPPPPGTSLTSDVAEPEFKINIEYRPADSLTPSQIGNEIARIQRRVNQIIEGTAD